MGFGRPGWVWLDWISSESYFAGPVGIWDLLKAFLRPVCIPSRGFFFSENNTPFFLKCPKMLFLMIKCHKINPNHPKSTQINAQRWLSSSALLGTCQAVRDGRPCGRGSFSSKIWRRQVARRTGTATVSSDCCASEIRCGVFCRLLNSFSQISLSLSRRQCANFGMASA